MAGPTFSVVAELQERHVHDLHRLFQGEWWTQGRSLADVRCMIDHSSLVFGLRADPSDRLVAFARVLTDRVFKAVVFDVIVARDHRHQGLGRRLMDCIIRHPDLRRVRHIELYCLPDLISFYERSGFSTDVSGVSLMRRKAG